MENRFGFKDLVICLLLGLLILLVIMTMVQYDRQWSRIGAINQKVDQQSDLLNQISRQLQQGVVAAPSATVQTQAASEQFGDPFQRIRAAQAKPDYAPGDFLVDAFGAKVAKITPLVASDAYGNAIIGYVTENLAERDPDTLEWSGLLAKSWRMVDQIAAWNTYVQARLKQPITESEILTEEGCPKEAGEKRDQYLAGRLKEGRRIKDIVREAACPPAIVIHFELRPGVTYSDGQPMTADDIVYMWELIQNPRIDAPRLRFGLDKIRNVIATGPLQLAFEFNEPYFKAFEEAAGFSPMPRHFYSKYTPEQINQTPGLLLGTGPYRMETPTDWTPGKPMILYRNRAYWGVRPAFDRLIFKEVSNPVAHLTMFRNREVDFFPAMPEQYEKLAQDKDLLQRTQHYIYERPAGGYGFIAWNQRKNGKPTLFSDARTRRAMTMLINWDRLNKDKLRGYGIQITGPFNRLSKQVDPAIQPWPFDVDQARQLLAEAGWKDTDADGWLDSDIDGSGRRIPFRFKYTFPSETGFWDDVALMMKDDFKRVGIDLQLDPLEWAVFEDRWKARDFDALSMAWTANIETDIQQAFHSAQAAPGGDNFTSYINPQLDQIIDQARQTLDESKRMELWQACHRIIHQDQPYTFLYTRKAIVFLDQRIQNVQRTRVGINSRYDWYVPSAMQMYRD